MKILFFGSDDFAATHLDELLRSQHQVLAVVTQPDRAKGRGLQVVLSPVKTIALNSKIPVLQPENLKDNAFIDQAKGFNCDLFVVIAYGRILPPEVLALPYICAVNVHGSLLPRYRGAAPINWAIINGDKETGISIIKMNPQMDAGDVLAQAKVRIEASDTAVTLRLKMAVVGKKALLKTIDSFEKNAYTLTVQDPGKVTLAPKLTKELGRIDWNKSAADIHNLARGLVPWPTAFTQYQGKLLKVLETQVVKLEAKDRNPGEVVEVTRDALIVAAGEDGVALKKVQPESGKAMDARSFAAGYKVAAGSKFE